MMKVLVLIICFAAAARSGHSLSYDHSWTPNIESVYKYTSPELIQALRKTAQPSTSILRHPLILTADVKVQAFTDQSLRVKLDHIRFYSNDNYISLKNAHQILEDELSNREGMSHNAQTFETYLETPILVHLKRGLVKKVIVSQNEPAEVAEIKKQLVSDLKKSSSQARLQLLMKKAIIEPLETPRFPMKANIVANGIGGGYATGGGKGNNGNSIHGMGDCPFHNQKSREVELSRDEEIADSATTTPNGCTCISLCETSVGADNFRYDWCKTKDECGEYTGFYYWDKCEYLATSKPEFTSLMWNEKHDQTWAKILADATVGPYPNISGIFTESVKTVFDNEWDVNPVGRKKIIHSVGAVCPFVVKIKDSPFTGVFQNGESHGMIRLGSAAPIKEGNGVTPGGGVKFFRSGKPSADFVVLKAFGPIENENYNFFAVPLSNHKLEEDPMGLAPLTRKFCQAKTCETKVGLSDASTYDQDGKKPNDIVFPFKVSFIPTGDIKFREEYSELDPFMKQFTDLPVGTVLYQLRGHQNPGDKEGLLLGDVVTTDNCVTSYYGDTKLFFKHQYIEEDKNLKPEWADGYDLECLPYCKNSQ